MSRRPVLLSVRHECLRNRSSMSWRVECRSPVVRIPSKKHIKAQTADRETQSDRKGSVANRSLLFAPVFVPTLRESTGRSRMPSRSSHVRAVARSLHSPRQKINVNQNSRHRLANSRLSSVLQVDQQPKEKTMKRNRPADPRKLNNNCFYVVILCGGILAGMEARASDQGFAPMTTNVGRATERWLIKVASNVPANSPPNAVQPRYKTLQDQPRPKRKRSLKPTFPRSKLTMANAFPVSEAGSCRRTRCQSTQKP